MKKLVMDLGDIPSFEAILKARKLPNQKVVDAIRLKESREFAAKKIKERKIKLGLIQEDPPVRKLET